jgi:hypothetical protein
MRELHKCMYNKSTNKWTHVFQNYFSSQLAPTFCGQPCGHHEGYKIQRLARLEI